MALITPENLSGRLLEIARRPRPIHANPCVIIPDASGEIHAGRILGPRDAFHVLELGAGWGEFSVAWLDAHEDHYYVAFELKGDRIKKLLAAVAKRGLADHIRIVPINFNWFLESLLPQHAFDLIVVNCPDPWPKRRHWKHRLVDGRFPDKAIRLLRPGGRLYLNTDYGPYARRMLSIFRRRTDFKAVLPYPHYQRERPEGFPATKFEAIHKSEGRRLYYMLWEAGVEHQSR